MFRDLISGKYFPNYNWHTSRHMPERCPELEYVIEEQLRVLREIKAECEENGEPLPPIVARWLSAGEPSKVATADRARCVKAAS